MNLPKNVFWFEVLLYASLMLDCLAVAVQDRTPTGSMTEQTIMAGSVVAGCFILLQVYFVYLAARHRKSWPRWVLSVLLLLSMMALGQEIGDKGLEPDSAIEIVSCALTVFGLYLSVTGDAKGWFNA
jgi:hypothetical protein